MCIKLKLQLREPATGLRARAFPNSLTIKGATTHDDVHSARVSRIRSNRDRAEIESTLQTGIGPPTST